MGSCEGDKYSIKMHYHRPPTMTSQDQEVLNKCNNDSPGLHGWECELSCGKGPELWRRFMKWWKRRALRSITARRQEKQALRRQKKNQVLRAILPQALEIAA